MFLNTQIDLLILKTCDGQFTLTTKKSLHIIFNATIHVVILLSVVECQHTEWRWVVSIFADMHHKSVTIATSLEQVVTVFKQSILIVA